MESITHGVLPNRDDFIAMADKECPDGYLMTIRDPDEWEAVAEVVNRGIDSHLEAVFCDVNNSTGEFQFKDGSSLYTFLRRIVEDPPECGENGCTEECFGESYDGEHCDISRVMGLAGSILYTLYYEWV